jgi:hypothetical protein
MRGNTIYLEAEDRTQDLLNIKWALRSAGSTIASNWHDSQSPFDLKDHWNASALERLQNCDCVVILSPRAGGTAPELAMMAGFALARGIVVSWIGTPVRGLCDFWAVRQFGCPGDFLKQLSSAGRSRAAAGRLAA